ncbi:hypothetical protein AAG906_004672 [Vitis piasezkii]
MILEHVLVLSAYLFSNGIYELITININFITFFDFFDNRQLKEYIFSIFVIFIAAAEAAFGPAIVSSIYHNRKSTCINQSNLLNK